MKLEIGTIFRTKDGQRIFKVVDVKMFPEPLSPFMLICLVEIFDKVEVEITFENLCEWFKQTEWEIIK